VNANEVFPGLTKAATWSPTASALGRIAVCVNAMMAPLVNGYNHHYHINKKNTSTEDGNRTRVVNLIESQGTPASRVTSAKQFVRRTLGSASDYRWIASPK
jgi:hypothetical protein